VRLASGGEEDEVVEVEGQGEWLRFILLRVGWAMTSTSQHRQRRHRCRVCVLRVHRSQRAALLGVGGGQAEGTDQA
jgi:hypothetical protein